MNSKPLRIWPGVALAAFFLVARFGVPLIAPASAIWVVFGGFGISFCIFLWWLLFSRAAWVERIGALVLIAAGLYATKRVVDVSIATGAEGMLLFVLALPSLAIALVVWAAATRHFSDTVRRVTMVLAILMALGAWTLVRTGGFTADFKNDLHWRWTPTPEQRLVAAPAPPVVVIEEKAAPKEVAVVAPKSTSKVLWSGFRGPDRDGVVHGVQINSDWTASPPVELWRHAVGPGWSSFAVSEDRIYTQEQRGPDEIVACYKLSTGAPVWVHRDAARFWESNGGPGPRGTPTLSDGRIYTLGATGILSVLDAANGAVVWSHNAATDTGAKIPEWGVSGSPLVTSDAVIVAASGRLIAYDRESGSKRWTGTSRGVSYSSPVQMTIDGVAQVVLMTSTGTTGVSLADGKSLWEHEWKGYPIVQPAILPDGGLLIAANESSGTRRLAVSHADQKWNVQERWTSMGLKPYFNDFVVHKGYAYGFDGSILSCIDLNDGTRKWKGGRYGNGQMILLADQDLLLVSSEEGELALVSATPGEFKEIARFKAIEGKTWNHPVLAGNILLERNGEEMAAFRLSLAAK